MNIRRYSEKEIGDFIDRLNKQLLHDDAVIPVYMTRERVKMTIIALQTLNGYPGLLDAYEDMCARVALHEGRDPRLPIRSGDENDSIGRAADRSGDARDGGFDGPTGAD